MTRCSAQVWIKQTDAKGNVYYFNQDTLESAWFPPCMVCMRLEAKKVCFSCEDAGQDGLFYCNECFEKVSDSAWFPSISQLELASMASSRRRDAVVPSSRPHESLRVA